MSRRFLVASCAALSGLLLGAISSGLHPGATAPLPGFTVPDSTPPPRRPIQGAASESEEAMGVALAALTGHPDLLDLARLGEELDRLHSSQISTLLDRLERDASDPEDDRMAWLFLWWTKRDPKAAAAWIQPRVHAAAQDGPPGMFFENSSSGKLILAWAKADPQAALGFARQHARCGLAKNLLIAAIDALPAVDRGDRLQLLHDFPSGRARNGALQHLLEDWAAEDPVGALANAQALPDEKERPKAASTVLSAWSRKDAGGALAKYQALGLSDPGLLSDLLTNLAEHHPAQAAESLAQLDAAQIARTGPSIVDKWAATDPAGALAWALDHGVSIGGHSNFSEQVVHDGLERSSTGMGGGINPLETALDKQPEATLAWIAGLPPGPDRDRLTELAAGATGLKLAQALQIFATLPPDAAARTARTLATRFVDDPAGGAEWASALPSGAIREQAWAGLGAVAGKDAIPAAGPDRDAFLSGEMFSSRGGYGPASGLQAAARISDPVMRHDLLDEAMETFAQISPAECRAWLETADVPEDWKGPWRAALSQAPSAP